MSGDVNMADLIAANPNFEQQMRDWQAERHQKGEDPTDWQAFRELETFIGAPDPGESAPAEFLAYTPPVVASEAPVTEAGDAPAADASSGEVSEAAPAEKSWAERWGTGSTSSS